MPAEASPASWPLTSPILFDDPDRDAEGGLLCFENPQALIEARRAEDIADALARIDAALEAGHEVAGFLAYELGHALEPSRFQMMPQGNALPLLHMGVFERHRRLDATAAAGFFEATAGEQQVATAGLADISPQVSRDTYLERFDKVMRYILAGDIYQLNLAFPVAFGWHGSPLALYARLRANQPVRHGGFLTTPDAAILSFSPELFFEVREGRILTRPMKGTMRRGIDAGEDARLRRLLAGDEKNRAENLMIVDLMRNDLARVSLPGSVAVSDLYSVETLPTLLQMTSGVEGRLRPGTGFGDLVRALFPAGSITGAPKIRAMQLIGALERRSRGVYTGSMGHIRREADGSLSGRFNVAIRTLTLTPQGTGETFVGSGLVADSQGAAEYDECLLKYRFLMLPDYQLIESLVLTPEQGLVLIERHLARLSRSAEALGFACPIADIEQALRQVAGERPRGVYRLRVLLWPSGRFELTAVPFELPDASEVVPLVVSKHRVDSAEPLQRHKTTRRQLYDGEWNRWHEILGAGEVLFLNERAELAEGSRSNIFIEKRCELLTPPIAAGLLPGTLREELISTGKARECVLTLADLQAADAIYVGNSVRGLQRGRLLSR